MTATGPRQDGKVPDPHWRRRTPLGRVLFSLTATLLAGLALAAIAVAVAIQAIYAPGPLSERKTVIIASGQRTAGIAAQLEREGIISNQRLFTGAAYFTSSHAGPLKPGEYEFEAAQSMAGVLALIRSGKAVVHKLTIPEGWTTEQALKRIGEHPALAGDIGTPPKEGELLPDTYIFHRGMKRVVLIDQMRHAQEKALNELWEKRAPDLPFSSKKEAITLASIVEKETGVPAERGQVAAVFINRLKKKMRLQSDPTIIYGIVGGKGRLDRPILRSDIETPTDYNTYRINGLPPGPIANPGRESIAAALNPGAGAYLYFVADGSGGHAFASSLAEHRENVRRWREIERARGRDEEALSAELEANAAEPSAEATKPSPAAGESPQPSELAAAEEANASESDAGARAGVDQKPETSLPPTPETKPAAEAATNAPDTAKDTASPAPAPEPDSAENDKQQAAETTQAPAPEANEAAEPAVREVKPGSVIRLADRLVPIPKPKPKRN